VSEVRGNDRTATCLCGRVMLETTGQPMVSADCHCTSCQIAGEQLEALAGAPSVLNADGGTSVVLFRKDRVRCISGQDLLAGHRLKPDSPTRRVVATCCNSAMVLDFTKGHWLSVYKNRLPEEDRPRAEMRAHTGRFMWRLLSTWAATGFRRVRVPFEVENAMS
jgi:hypothetical protein